MDTHARTAHRLGTDDRATEPQDLRGAAQDLLPSRPKSSGAEAADASTVLRARSSPHRTSLIAALVTCLVGCAAEPGDPGQPATLAVRAEIHPQSILLLPGEEGAKLEVTVYTDDGGELPSSSVAWISSDPSVVRVDADGTLHRQATRGSATVTAIVDGLRTSPAFVLVATPADGAVLVDDAQVVKGPYDLTDEESAANRYGVTMREDTGVEVGDVVLAKGAAQVAGRVVALAPGRTTGEIDAVVELLPLDELFDDLQVDLALDESALAVTVPEEIAERYDVVRHEDGRVDLTPRETSSSSAGLARRSLEFEIGPFKCVTENPITVGFVITPAITIDPTLDLRLRYDSAQGGLEELILSSALQVSAELQTQLSATVQAKVECTVEMLVATIPIGGPIALVFGGQVPLGIGFEGALAFPTTVGMKAILQAGYTSRIGLLCTSGACEMVNELETSATGSVDPVIVVPNRFNIEAFGFGFAKLSLGSKLLNKLRFEFFVVKAGLKLDAKFAFSKTIQAEDPTFASEYKLLFAAAGELGQSFDNLLGFIKVTSTKVEAKVEAVLDSSPQGALSVSPAEVAPGETVSLRVDLADLDFLGQYNVEAVGIYRATESADGDLNLESVAHVPAGVDQSSFTATWVPEEEDVGTQSFYAFVDTVRFGLSAEIAADSKKDLVVEPIANGVIGNIERQASTYAYLFGRMFFDGVELEPTPAEASQRIDHPVPQLGPFLDSVSLSLPNRTAPDYDARQSGTAVVTHSSNLTLPTNPSDPLTLVIHQGASAELESIYTLGNPFTINVSANNEGAASQELLFEIQEGQYELHLTGTITVSGNARAVIQAPRMRLISMVEGTRVLDERKILYNGQHRISVGTSFAITTSRYGGLGDANVTIDATFQLTPVL